MTLTENLRFQISRRGLTVTAAAAKCGIGRVTLQRYLSGSRTPDLTQLARLAKALGTTVSKLTKGL